MNSTKLKRFIGCLLILVSSSVIRAAVLDFESLPGGVPLEGMVISNQFAGQFGMTFSGSNAPVIVRRGSPQTGFNSPWGDDTLSPTNTHDCGEFYLLAPEITPLVVRFTSPVSTFSFYVLDLDDTERVTLTAYTSTETNGVRTNIFRSTDPGFGNGYAGLASISVPSNAIARVEVRLSDSDGAFGAAFDDFTSTFTPTPAHLMFHSPNQLEIRGEVGRAYRVDYASD